MSSNTWNTIATKTWSGAVQYYYSSTLWKSIVKQTVVVIAAAGAEALRRQGDQTWTFIAFVDGADSDAAPESDLRVISFFACGIVVVIAAAGAEASHRQGGQTWTFTASINGASSVAAPSLTDKQSFSVKGSAA